MNGIKSARTKLTHIPTEALNYVRVSLGRGSAASENAVQEPNTFKYALENHETPRSKRPRCSYHRAVNHRGPSGQRPIPEHLQALEIRCRIHTFSLKPDTVGRGIWRQMKVTDVPISTSEKLRLREVFGYPGSDKLPNEVQP